MYCIEISQRMHRYGRDEMVLKGINLQVPTGSIDGFLGPNGAGKTTAINQPLVSAGIAVSEIAFAPDDLESIFLQPLAPPPLLRMFLHGLQCEWRKTRRSLAAWLVIVGSLFTPAIVVVARLVRREHLPELYAGAESWPRLRSSARESMAIFFLPMAAILITTPLSQLEYRNNAWKLVHVLPLSLGTIFWTKLAKIVVLRGLSADCGAAVCDQPAVSSFLIPLGVGFLTWVGALAVLSIGEKEEPRGTGSRRRHAARRGMTYGRTLARSNARWPAVSATWAPRAFGCTTRSMDSPSVEGAARMP